MSPVPVDVVASDVGRYPPSIEAAAYFACLEALQNAAKHSGASSIRVELHSYPEGLAFAVEDDGRGFDTASTPAGAGLANLRDRIECVGGVLTSQSAPGEGTRIDAVLPSVGV
jgi:signal transduction histidine kinase